MRVESAGSISDLIPAGDLLYFLRVNNGNATLMRRNSGQHALGGLHIPLGSAVSTLTYYGGNIYALIDNKLNVIYPATGQCMLLSGTTIAGLCHRWRHRLLHFRQRHDALPRPSPCWGTVP